jgi:hypothetical protein
MTSAIKNTVLKQGDSSERVVKWAQDTTSTVRDLRPMCGRKGLGPAGPGIVFLDSLQEKCGNTVAFNYSSRAFETAVKDYARTSTGQDNPYKNVAKHEQLKAAMAHVAVHGPGSSVVVQLQVHLRAINIRESQYNMVDTNEPPPTTPGELALYNAAKALATAMEIDDFRMEAMINGIDEVMTGIRHTISPILARDIEHRMAQIPINDRSNASINYFNTVAQIFYDAIQGGNMAQRAELTNKIIFGISQVRAEGKHISNAAGQVRMLPAAFQEQACLTAFGALGRAISTNPAISFKLQSVCQSPEIDKMTPPQLMNALEKLATDIAAIEAVSSKENSSHAEAPRYDAKAAKSTKQKGAQGSARPIARFVDKPPPEGAPPRPKEGVKTRATDNAPLCANCNAVSRWEASTSTWHTAQTCRRPSEGPAKKSHNPQARRAATSNVDSAASTLIVYDQYNESSEEEECLPVSTPVSAPDGTIPITARTLQPASRTHTVARRPTMHARAHSLTPSEGEVSLLGDDPHDEQIRVEAWKAKSAARSASGEKRSLKQTPNMLDGGCGPAHVMHSQHAVGTPIKTKIKIQGVSRDPIGGNTIGKAAIKTQDTQGNEITLELPGTSMFLKDEGDTSLISHSTLLEHQWEVDLTVNGGTIKTPSGTHIALNKKGSCWYFPDRKSSSSTQSRTNDHNKSATCVQPSCKTEAPMSRCNDKERGRCYNTSPLIKSNTYAINCSNSFACLSNDKDTDAEKAAQEEESDKQATNVELNADNTTAKAVRPVTAASTPRTRTTRRTKGVMNSSSPSETLSASEDDADADFENERVEPIEGDENDDNNERDTPATTSKKLNANFHKLDLLHHSYGHPSEEAHQAHRESHGRL